MIVGVIKETKSDEYRVALLPVGAELLVGDGHEVLIEKGAGEGSGFDDELYERVGAAVVDSVDEIYERAEMVMGVKEPQRGAIPKMKEGQIVFCYYHLAASRELTESCLEQGITAVAFETLMDRDGHLPMLTPMSEVAGKMAIQEGAKYLERPMMGRGVLLGGVPGVEPGNVVVLGGGVVGTCAASGAAGMGADGGIMDINLERLRYLDEVMPWNVTTIYSDPHAIDHYVRRADLVVGAVLIPGKRAPHLVRREQLSDMKQGAVIVDVCIDQGGCIETSKATTHKDPVYVVDGVVHYGVANMPGAVSRTSSQALGNATLFYARQLAKLGIDGFVGKSEGHAAALNIRDGKLAYAPVADTFEDMPRADRLVG